MVKEGGAIKMIPVPRLSKLAGVDKELFKGRKPSKEIEDERRREDRELKSASGKLKVILDTKPLIKLFAQEEGWESVREILSKVEGDKLEAGISVVTLTEIYYKYVQEGRSDLAISERSRSDTRHILRSS